MANQNSNSGEKPVMESMVQAWDNGGTPGFRTESRRTPPQTGSAA